MDKYVSKQSDELDMLQIIKSKSEDNQTSVSSAWGKHEILTVKHSDITEANRPKVIFVTLCL